MKTTLIHPGESSFNYGFFLFHQRNQRNLWLNICLFITYEHH
jgi:hypothetical protein